MQLQKNIILWQYAIKTLSCSSGYTSFRNSSKQVKLDVGQNLKSWNTDSKRLHGKLLGRVSKYRLNVESKKRNTSEKTICPEKLSLEKPKLCLNNQDILCDISHLTELNNKLMYLPSSRKLGSSNINLDMLNSIKTVPLAPSESIDFDARLSSQEKEFITVKSLPGVTKILDKTMPAQARANLERWKEKQIELLGEDGFYKLQQETLRKGKNLHLCIQELLSGRPEIDIDIGPEVSNFWKSIRHIFRDLSDVEILEGYVTHPLLHYTGYVDCIAKYKNKLCVLDWKTTTKQKPYLSSTFDNPLQLAAYAGAVNYSQHYNKKINQCALVIAYADGTPAHGHIIPEVKLLKYWGKWLERVELYWKTRIQQSI